MQNRQNPLLPHNTPSFNMGEEDGYASSSSDTHPLPRLQSLIEDKASLVLGRSPAVVMKTKHHSAHEWNKLLFEQLMAVKVELKKR